MICLRRSRSKIDIHANFHRDKKRAFEKELLINQRRIRRGEIQKHTFNSVEVIVNTENPEVGPIATASIEYYGLNRKELKDHRYTFYSYYSGYRQILESDRIPSETRTDLINTIERMKAPGAPFAGMIRYFDAPFSQRHSILP